MKHIALILFASLLFGFSAHAGNDNPNSPEKKQNGTISGKVVDQLTGEGLSGVKVCLGNGLTSYTDLDGNFNIEVDANHVYQIQANYISYESLTLSNLKIQPGQKQVIRMELKSLND
ncbi:MAG TPA: carboxypeptidase-like regulatory domain-containing protein [Bacteroidales bacterium]|nr:carboxypeptidase-like regulatory domain-containing protein [Bacteroidales bacterium]HQL71081.1 carboxypeptidase-like regulatory domain-containing protein [Bacteroidales bacterium]